MLTFSQMLDKQINSSKITVAKLAEQSGIERTSIVKMCKGERLFHDEKRVEKLISLLRCSPSQERELLSRYKLERIGPERFEKLNAVKYMCESLGQLHKLPSIKSNVTDPPQQKAFYGKTDVDSIMNIVLSNEAALPGGRIRLICQPQCKMLLEMLPGIIGSLPNLRIQHIVCLKSAGSQGADVFNMESFNSLTHSIISGFDYQIMYYYGDEPVQACSSGVFPHVIITSSCVLTVSYDCMTAVLHDDTEVIDAYNRIFEKMQGFSRPLVKPLTFESFLEYYQNSLKTNWTDTLMCMSDVPPLTPFITKEIAQKLILPDMAELAEPIFKLLDASSFEECSKCFKFATEEGIRYFVENGRIGIIPEELYSPVSIEDRVTIFQSFYDICRTDFYHMHILKPDAFNPPLSNNFFIESFNHREDVLYFSSQDNPNKYFILLESSINESIHDFMQYLQDPDMSYSEDESLVIIENALAKLKSKV